MSRRPERVPARPPTGDRPGGRTAERRGSDASAIMAGVVREERLTGRVLVVDDDDGSVEAAVSEVGAQAVPWRRFARGGRGASAWPSAGPFDAATIRLPKVRLAFEMALHAVAARLRPGATLYVHGGNDEGIQGATKPMAALLGRSSTRDARRHCRVECATLSMTPPELRGELDDWLARVEVRIDGEVRHFVTLPGLFNKGQMDEGTAMLLEAMAATPAPSSALDFGCGSGLIGATLAARGTRPERLILLDADALAVEAARRNVPGAQVVCDDGLQHLGAQRFACIASNPPFHDGKARDHDVLRAFIAAASGALEPEGALWLVVQRVVRVELLLAERFGRVEVVRENGRFRVFVARP